MDKSILVIKMDETELENRTELEIRDSLGYQLSKIGESIKQGFNRGQLGPPATTWELKDRVRIPKEEREENHGN